MPTYEYQCNACGRSYDVFHKVREVIEDVVCPVCGSSDHTRLLSAPSVHVAAAAAGEMCDRPGCAGGRCEFAQDEG